MTSNISFEDKELQALLNPFAIPLRQKISANLKRRKVIIIAGPTGVGKTQLSLIVARVIGGEVVSADSMQVYRGMDIGTAKVKPSDRGNIRHHLIDSRDLDETFNVVDFYRESLQAFREILARDHVPIVVGGTGFYMQALLCGPPQGPPSVPEVRERLEHEIDVLGPLALYDRLKVLDPDYARQITSADRHKIVRALEIITLTGQKVSSLERSRDPLEDYDFRCWFLHMPRDLLYKRVEERCEEMLREGFVDEVRKLEGEGLRQNASASQAIGYRQCLDYFNGPQTPEDWITFVAAFKQASRRYVKRQFTWFRKEPLFRWVDVEQLGLDTVAELILQDYETS